MGYKKEWTEDEIRDKARKLLKFDDKEKNVKQGVGQQTTLNDLGLKGSEEPDGWYLPEDKNEIAIICEFKNSEIDIKTAEATKQIKKYIKKVQETYNKVIGILWNGGVPRIFLNDNEYEDKAITLQNKAYYKQLFRENIKIDTQLIYNKTMSINNNLHYNFGLNDYYDRMIFTACALVAENFGANLSEADSFNILISKIKETIENEWSNNGNKGKKLGTLIELFGAIKPNYTYSKDSVKNFVIDVRAISKLIDSAEWNGEDVMSILFREFTRYKSKSENGQVFTPDHITSFMYRLIDVRPTDRVLDACCGSGAFLTRAMSNMIHEVGGFDTREAKNIMQNQIYGIELDRRVFSLACANMLIHKDGKTNLEQMDAKSDEAAKFIRDSKITKVLMNPPYEKQCKPEQIVENVLNNVEPHTLAAFLLPDQKLEKVSKKTITRILSNHRLLKIIKIPEATFDEGVSTSIFIFETGVAHGERKIKTWYLEDDGLERVKNQGRQDIKNRWKAIEDEWVDKINNDEDFKLINPKEHLSYQKPETPFVIYEEDFMKTMMDYIMFEKGINVKDFKENLVSNILYSSDIKKDDEDVVITIRGEKDG